MATPWYTKRRTRRRIARTVVALAVVLAGYYSQSHPNQTLQLSTAPPAGTYRVVTFDDGDTIVVDMNGTKETVRFIGVDTPETHDPRKAVQCFGHAAADYTKKRIGDQPVRLETDPLGTNRDRYNRLLRYVYLPDGTLINADIIEHGYGFAYLSFPFTKSDQFRQLQTAARSAEKGLWHDCNPAPNKYGGYTSPDAN